MKNTEFFPHQNSQEKENELQENITNLRSEIHQSMEQEFSERLKSNPLPTEEEIRMAAFAEWLEPQAREALQKMYKKGYATKSSGFYGENHLIQAVDGYFFIDPKTKDDLSKIGVEVLTGPDLGLPENKLIRQIRFYPTDADIEKMKEKWNQIAEILPEVNGPIPISDRIDEFLSDYYPNQYAFEKERDEYWDWIKNKNNFEE